MLCFCEDITKQELYDTTPRCASTGSSKLYSLAKTFHVLYANIRSKDEDSYMKE
jgi:hypothetical protein